MDLCNFLLNKGNDYNGHKQHEWKGLTIEEGLEIVQALEVYTKHKYIFYLQVYSDKSYTICQSGYWKPGEQVNGDTDRNILGVETE